MKYVEMDEVVLHNQPVMRVDTPDRNGFVYPADVIEEMVQRLTKPVYGTIGQPNTDPMLNINVCDISHKAENFHIADGKLVADITILNTQQGSIYKQMLDNDVPLRLSTGGIGVVDHKTDSSGKNYLYVSKYDIKRVSVMLPDEACWE